LAQSGIITFLFTDLTQSTQHLQRVGDEAGQRLFRNHHKNLSEAVLTNGGEELEWLGDGILAAFSSPADAVRCAISIEQTARRPGAETSFEIRIGIHAGEALRREGGYFGTPIVTARRLCDRAAPGQILCSRIVTELLEGRQDFSFRDLGMANLKGLDTPVDISEVVYARNDPVALLNRTPFVGRTAALERLSAQFEAVSNGRGGVAIVLGEPGLGKTRLLEEFADLARQRGAMVLRGACYDGEWQRPYGPFVEIILEYARQADLAALNILAGLAPILARAAPELRTFLKDIPEPAPIDKDEERLRLFDAVMRLLIEVSARRPVLLILDDLHWADYGTSAMLSHLVHFVEENPIQLIGAYRDAEVERQHPLNKALLGIRRLQNFESIALEGLSSGEIASLLSIIGDQPAPPAMIDALARETDGNPFLLREVLLHLRDQGLIFTQHEVWASDTNVASAGIPAGVRELVRQRVLRLSENANRLLTVGAAFNGAFSFDIAAAAAELDEQTALAALDEALEAKLLSPGKDADRFDFAHAIIRDALYSELTPVRRTRLHLRIAEEMERSWGELASEHAAEVAYHFWRSAGTVGAARGADYALAAAENAESAYASDEVAAFLRIALELLPADDARRPRLLARQGLALTVTPRDEEARRVILEAATLIASSEGTGQAAQYLTKAARSMFAAGLLRGAWELAAAGLRYAGDRRDAVWASLRELDLMRETADEPTYVGIRPDTPQHRELRAVMRQLPVSDLAAQGVEVLFDSRRAVLASEHPNLMALLFQAGELRAAGAAWRITASEAEQQGRIAWAMMAWACVARAHCALGEFTESRAASDRATALSGRVVGMSVWFMNMLSAQHDLRVALDDGWLEVFQDPRMTSIAQQTAAENLWVSAAMHAGAGYLLARINQAELAVGQYKRILPAIERGAAWNATYTTLVCDAAAILWFAKRTDAIEVVERNLLNKVIAADFRTPMRDARLSMARVCALQGRYQEASEWFAKARAVLDEQGARPLRAITDYDEGLMLQRQGDSAAAAPLLQTALKQFRAVEMTGWVRAVEMISN